MILMNICNIYFYRAFKKIILYTVCAVDLWLFDTIFTRREDTEREKEKKKEGKKEQTGRRKERTKKREISELD